ncbi:MAG TPA: hypothetical protein GX734_03870 [Clostridiaceae bacterium]|jgi:cell division protein FtsL|nr:hypothetical protein [Clostridiaceae bacterium]
MRYYSDGNLAEQLSQQPIPYELPDVYIPHPDEVEEQKRRNRKRLEEVNHVRYQYKSITRSRARVSLRLLSVLLALATVVGYIVWRSAKVTEMSFYNAGLKRQIKELDKQNSLLQDKIFSKSSPLAVKDVATSELGLQKPSSEQILYVPAAILTPALSDEEAAEVHQDNTARISVENMKLIESWVRSH